MEQTTQTLTEYLKIAADLECSAYRQEQVIKQAKEDVKLVKPNKERIDKPVNARETTKKPEKPTKAEVPQYVKNSDIEALKKEGRSGASNALLGVGIACFVLGVVMFGNSAPLGIVFFIAGVSLLLGSGFATNSAMKKSTEDKNKAAEVQYQKELAEYEQRMVEADVEYEKALAEYKSKVSSIESQYQSDLIVAKKNYQAACDEITVLEEHLADTRRTLERLYSNDWIYGKYRNLVAMTTMYEYFITGRCSELAGPDGAYNLYEQETRQNVIISQLDRIGSQLEDIKANQYLLYTEVKKTNELVEDVVGELKDVNKGISDLRSKAGEIAKNTRTSAYYAEITAKNTEALKYIELVTQ